MYVVQEYLICVLLALLCTGLVFAVWTVLVLANEGAKVLEDLARNAIASRGQMNGRHCASWREVVAGSQHCGRRRRKVGNTPELLHRPL